MSSVYGSVFHDIKDGTTNGYYPAVAGFDLATGWGSMISSVLVGGWQELRTSLAAPSGLTVVAHNQVLTLNWSAFSGELQLSR